MKLDEWRRQEANTSAEDRDSGANERARRGMLELGGGDVELQLQLHSRCSSIAVAETRGSLLFQEMTMVNVPRDCTARASERGGVTVSEWRVNQSESE